MIDTTLERRMYFNGEVFNKQCPECHQPLVAEPCNIKLMVQLGDELESWVTNRHGGIFCPTCPVVVFDEQLLSTLVGEIVADNTKEARFFIVGIVDLSNPPADRTKRMEVEDLEIIYFLDREKDKYVLNKQKNRNINQPLRDNAPKIGRNDPCSCGSAIKFKKCCGK